MKYLLIPVFLGIAIICHAQKWPKNELNISFYPAGYFCDSTAFKISTFAGARNFVFIYTRNFAPRISSSVLYASYFFSYVDPKYRLEDNTVESRYVRRIALTATSNISVGCLYFRIKTGLNYCWGYKMNHYYYFGGGIWEEPVSEGISYKKWGVTTALSIDHKIVRGLFGSIQADYVRMLKGVDPNQLYLSYALGYRF